MGFPIDLTKWRVYSAEQSLPTGQLFDSIEDAKTYLWWVQSTKWWRTTFPDAPKIAVELGGNADGERGIQSYAQAVDDGDWIISLHPQMMHANVLLHEVAHCIAPKRWGDVNRISKGKLDGGSHHSHGEYFRAAFASLAERYQIGVDPQELRRAYEHFELETPDLDALVAARQQSVDVERAYAEMWEWHEREWSSDPEKIALREKARLAGEEHRAELEARGESREEGWVPPDWWGDWIWLTRGHYRPKISQKRLAAEVAPVVRCSTRDVARLERIKGRPTNPIDMQRCIAFVAVMQLDPVWAETHKGLAAGESTLTLEQLEPVATEWVDDVRHLNALLEARPPRWEAPGDR